MKILFCARHFGYLRNFESVIRELSNRGHELHLVADREESYGGLQMVMRLAKQCRSVSFGRVPTRETDGWLEFATIIRLAQDYLRFLDHRYDRAPKIRQRAKVRTSSAIIWLIEHCGFRYRPGRAVLSTLFKLVEQAIPRSKALDAFIQAQNPDVVLLTPLIDLGSPQLDLLKSAKASGYRTVLCVGSWDHLSSKALLRIWPDLVTVWNPLQKQEAIELHKFPAQRVAITGSQCYDQWFGRQPSRSREEFCQAMGLSSSHPFLLYVCSSLFRGGPPEADFIATWIKDIRSYKSASFQNIGILIRPHPGRITEWTDVDKSEWSNIVLHGGNPIDDSSKADYFDALYYSEAVIGLNTSAFLEAAIIGKPVLTVLHNDYWKSQEGTLHFHYLLTVGGGLLRTASDLKEHLNQIDSVLNQEEKSDNRHYDFVVEFLRPHGLTQSATPLFSDAIERLAETPLIIKPRKLYAVVPLTWILSVLIRFRLLSNYKKRFRKVRKDWKHYWHKNVDWLHKKIRRSLERYVKRPLIGTTKILIPGTIRANAPITDGFEKIDTVQLTREVVTELGNSRGPIILGPWLSETGFELLYWIPFLRWAKAYGNLREDRLIVISRGGAEPWYRDLASTYWDIFDHFSPEVFRAKNLNRMAKQDGQKHIGVSDLDKELIDRVKSSMSLSHVHLLHPSLMYNLLNPFWLQHLSIDLVHLFTAHRRMTPDSIKPLKFEEPYIAVKFYSNDAFPGTPENKRFVSDLLGRLTERYHVVSLNTGIQSDEHLEFQHVRRDRIHSIEELTTPSNNLAIQTAVIAGAKALISTYGGFSYLGPLCGVNTVAFYSNRNGFRFDHMDVASRVFRQVEGGAYITLHRKEIDFVDLGLGQIRPMFGVH